LGEEYDGMNYYLPGAGVQAPAPGLKACRFRVSVLVTGAFAYPYAFFLTA